MMQKAIIILFLVVGITTGNSQRRYELPELRASAELRVHLASKEIGITEENNSLRVYEFQKAVGITRRDAWCSAFQYYIANKAAMILKQYNPYPKSGLANAIYRIAITKGVRTKYNALVGDYIIWKVANAFYGHIGIIAEVKQNKVYTIEGNTGSVTIRTGGMVAKKFRSITNPIGKLKVRGLVGFKPQVF